MIIFVGRSITFLRFKVKTEDISYFLSLYIYFWGTCVLVQRKNEKRERNKKRVKEKKPKLIEKDMLKNTNKD